MERRSPRFCLDPIRHPLTANRLPHMSRLSALALTLLVALAPTAGRARDSHILWAVKGQHNTVYLLGSVHVLRPQDAGLPSAMERAYQESERLVMEIDL